MLIVLSLLLIVTNFTSILDGAPRPREILRSGQVSGQMTVVPGRGPLDKQIAGHFAPIFRQGLGENPRADYITNFDFDGDWKGDNNWQNLDNSSYPLRAYVYYSVAETTTHYFVHYAIFHPRDYKSDLVKTAIVDVLVNEGVRQIGRDPTGGLADDIALSHENDLEGCLVVAEKNGQDLDRAVVKYVETMAHNRYLKYCPDRNGEGLCEPIVMKGSRPLIFIEPKGHGPLRFTGDRHQLKNCVNGMIDYSYTGRAEDPDQARKRSIGYDLLPIYDTLWIRAWKGESETYGEVFDYETRHLQKYDRDKAPDKVEQKFSSLGSAFLGTVGSKNKARPPWAWFDDRERDRPRGEWFFDPASVIARHFNLGEEFSTLYLYNPYFKVGL